MKKNINEAEQKILAIVKKQQASTPQVVATLRKDIPGISESQGRQIIWQLIDRGRIKLSEDRVLTLR